MIIKEDLYIDDLHYILKFNHYDFSFYLNNISSNFTNNLRNIKKEIQVGQKTF